MISLTSPVKTRAHSWPAAYKLAALCLATLALFLLHNPLLQAAGFALTLLLYTLPGPLFFRGGMERLFVLWPFVAILGIWHLATQTYEEGLVIVLRLLSAVGLANLVTMTTQLSEMIAIIRWLATPFRRLGLNTRALEMSIALVIRLVPVLLENGQALSLAWRARSPRRPNWRIAIPFTLVTIDEADHIADALKARGGLEQQE